MTYNTYLKWVIEVTNQEYNGSIKGFNKEYNKMYGC